MYKSILLGVKYLYVDIYCWRRCKTICDGDAKEFEPIWLENVVERGDRCSMYIKQNSSSSSESSCPADWFDKSTKVPCEEYVFKDDYTFVEEVSQFLFGFK